MVQVAVDVYYGYLIVGAEVLAGRAKSVSANHYLLNEIDRMTEQYYQAWKNLMSD
jgi:hypothetical protein